MRSKFADTRGAQFFLALVELADVPFPQPIQRRVQRNAQVHHRLGEREVVVEPRDEREIRLRARVVGVGREEIARGDRHAALRDLARDPVYRVIQVIVPVRREQVGELPLGAETIGGGDQTSAHDLLDQRPDGPRRGLAGEHCADTRAVQSPLQERRLRRSPCPVQPLDHDEILKG
jgi:hypothetical protein